MAVKEYKTKPIIIEAVEWTGSNREEIESFCREDKYFFEEPTESWGIYTLYIKTLEGNMKANPGDFIIKGTLGEFYPCKPGAFHNKYEEID